MSVSVKHTLITGAGGFIGSHLSSFLDRHNTPYTKLVRKRAENNILVEANQKDKKSLLISWPEDIGSINFADFDSVVHLAHPQITQNQSKNELYDKHIKPLELLISQISNTNPLCHLIFVSSQSSKENTDSNYGKIKYHMEDLIKKSSLPWTIIVPGLVYGNSNKGLYGSIKSLIKIAPVIPAPQGKNCFVQPVAVSDVVRACFSIINNGEVHNKRTYYLANEPIKFVKFISEIAKSQKKKRLIIPVPDSLILLALGILELLFKNPPFTKTNYIGLMNNTPVDHVQSWKDLNISPLSLEQGLLDEASQNYQRISEQTVRIEAMALFYSLFKRQPNEHIVSRYIQAHHKGLFDQKIASPLNISYIIEKRLDIEAIELASRRKNPALKNRLLLLSYLAEVDMQYQEVYIAKERKRLTSYATLAIKPFQFIYKRIKGSLLLVRYPQCMT